MLLTTKGILLKTIKYGDTSLIAHIFTEQFGLQLYMLKGVRSNRRNSAKASLLQPSALLNLAVYHQPQKNFQIIKDFSADESSPYFYDDVVKNCIAIFAVELLSNLLRADDTQANLFEFSFEFFQILAKASVKDCSNLPLYFLIGAAKIAGYSIEGKYDPLYRFVDIHNGRFTNSEPAYLPIIQGESALNLSIAINIETREEFLKLSFSTNQRMDLLDHYLQFLQLHAPGFKPLKSLPVLTTILH